MRVHGDKIIRRRQEVIDKSDYHAYLPELREDFQHICGYCGKSETVAKNTFEIDHFIPLKYEKFRKNDYTNLVYSCFECNRKKSDKWPSQNADIQFINGKGFVDPASDDYDMHLKRTKEGDIIGKTPAGEYMVSEGFRFDQRPIKEIWKAMQLIEKKNRLKKKMMRMTADQLRAYIIIDEQLEKLQKYLFGIKE